MKPQLLVKGDGVVTRYYFEKPSFKVVWKRVLNMGLSDPVVRALFMGRRI